MPPAVRALVERYQRNRSAYESGAYNETQLRRELIDPFFEALGWDVNNVKGYAEAYKDVVHEPSMEIEGTSRNPDYAFTIGGKRKFFVEAKKPSVPVKDDATAAFQLRRYGWSGKLGLSILTNFRDIAVYDCTSRPVKSDSAGIGRIASISIDELEQRWEWFASVFSRDAVLRGAFDAEAKSHRGKRGTQEVDEQFLIEIEQWREDLAKNIALRNRVTPPELNYAVQQTIDRIIFLRICEDRGIEPEGALYNLLNDDDIYERLTTLFKEADERYNSGMFHFYDERDRHELPDILTPQIHIDDRPLKHIITNLYYPSPYAFSVIPADILGQVYERFLGKVIRLTPQGFARVDEKPEVKKAGGVYYTPSRIVEYIVDATLGRLLDGKTPTQAAKLRILDPACGSGSFLIAAYQYLLDWHIRWYIEHGPAHYRTLLVQGSSGAWRLTSAARKRILLHSIYGVDRDPQAVEVTKLSLLLKVLEGEDRDSLAMQKRLFHERALPDLGANIRCGNSLIGPDFETTSSQMDLLDSETSTDEQKVNPFDWSAEFRSILGTGGFDAVIGNPPYLFITELQEAEKAYFGEKYATCEYRFDVYGLFIELAVERLLRHRGLLSFIIPHTLLSNTSFERLRRSLLDRTDILRVVDIGPGVFKARNETMILLVQRGREGTGRTEVVITNSRDFPAPERRFKVSQRKWLRNDGGEWQIRVSRQEAAIIAKLEAVPRTLNDLCTINQGLRTGDNERYLSSRKASGVWQPAVGGAQIARYGPLSGGLYVYYRPEVLDAPRSAAIFESEEKLVAQEVRNIALKRRIVAAYDDGQVYCLQSTNVINLRPLLTGNLKYLLAIINSNLINFWFRQRFSGNNHIASYQLGRIPIPEVSHSREGRLVRLVTQLLAAKREVESLRSPDERTRAARRIEALDRRIDAEVYAAFNLESSEFQLVEAARVAD
jgi:type I restriction-modification system DNA methylase subunit